MQEIKTISSGIPSIFDESVNKYLSEGFTIYSVAFPSPGHNPIYQAILLKETIGYVKKLPMI
jgi:hypothetical protein